MEVHRDEAERPLPLGEVGAKRRVRVELTESPETLTKPSPRGRGFGWLVLIMLLWSGRALAQVAIVNGESISVADIEEAAAHELKDLEFRKLQFENQLEREKKTILEEILEKLIRERVLAAEAKKRNVSVDELLAMEADAFVARLKREYEAKSYLEPSRTLIATSGRPSRGPLDAPVTIVEFSDFQCPYCRALFPTLRQIEADYTGKVRIVYLQFPLVSIHPDARKAAEASLCAYEQGKFWELHDAMFNDQANLGVEHLKEKASQLSLDPVAFGACLDSGKYIREIAGDVNEAVKAGVSGTPALFINGRFLEGNQAYRDIQRVIEDELERRAYIFVR
jgi:protein-disulfide isomerase